MINRLFEYWRWKAIVKFEFGMPESLGEPEEWIGDTLQLEPQRSRSLAYRAAYEVLQTPVGVLVACLTRGLVGLDVGAEADGLFGN